MVRAHVRWFARARFDDYLVAAGAMTSGLPLIGRHLEPIAGIATLGAWGVRYLPDFVTSARSRVGPGAAEQRRTHVHGLGDVMTAGMRDVLAADALAQPWPVSDTGAPWRNAAGQRRAIHRASVPYGDEPGQVLDVWRRVDVTGPAPVLVFIPGGAWIFGSRILQGHELMAHLVELGWVCLSVQYRTSPKHRWPRQIIDVKTAIAWARRNVGQFGGDREFVAVAGCSAGGHMASLVGLTPGDSQWQQGLPASADTSVDAVVSVYGRYDWEDRSTPERARFMDFLERVVVKREQSRRPGVFQAASPMARVNPSAPPFLVLHGDKDVIIPVGEARSFVERMRAVSKNSVGYVELPGAGHGFDLTDGTRTSAAVRASGLFLEHAYRTRPQASAVATG
ncbi:alpha/beta hydrolase [Mycobacterium sp. 236(2023)]|uniref:alpha/beta hydrolase n=1 Tax=Mycobacterium sp. 236(2023) TaxID=3038163 RepID=UPI00241584D6|nr:alpha/beta hydrolase [Mycobacterium sp. 236(2023)]MDG4664499.1 alpha/beta hydrolase [Mycobacterium sp. 236(2023)]